MFKQTIWIYFYNVCGYASVNNKIIFSIYEENSGTVSQNSYKPPPA